MPNIAIIEQSDVFEQGGVSIMARLVGWNTAVLQQAGITAINYKIFDTTSPASPISTGGLTISVVIFDTLQTDARWTKDIVGYNFRWDAPASILPQGDKTYRAEFYVDPVTGENFSFARELRTKNLYGL